LEVEEESFNNQPDSEAFNQDNNTNAETQTAPANTEKSTLDIDSNSDSNLPEELPVDSQWDDIYQPEYQGSSLATPATDDINWDERNSRSDSLQDKLYWQLNLTKLVDSDREMATAIIDAVLPSGFLSLTPEDIFENLPAELDVEFEEFEAVRKLIQLFEPTGVASKGLQECLLVQLNQMPNNTPFVNDAKLIISRYLNLLGNHDYAQLSRRTRFKEGRLRETVDLIQSLTPQPGDAVDNNDTEYIAPDVYVKKEQNAWTVELNGDCSPKLRINNEYASLIKRADNSNDNNFLKDNLQEARWFIKSLHSRNETLLKVASKIIEHQRGFLEHGEEAMKPLILADIANEVEMHESTISRVTTRKYMLTPRGIFELKYFFSRHVSTDSGCECSSTAIRAMIKKLISQEQSKKPLSDNKITQLLADSGIKVARRTVAKYRESMNIPPSNERKRLS
jgi:RNA polymerase sigma-54 factor